MADKGDRPMKIFPVSRYRIKNHAGELLFPTVRQYTTKLPKREDLFGNF